VFGEIDRVSDTDNFIHAVAHHMSQPAANLLVFFRSGRVVKRDNWNPRRQRQLVAGSQEIKFTLVHIGTWNIRIEGTQIMTAQIGERLCYDGRDLSMCSQPLSDYFTLAGARPAFDTRICTALWRGYVGTWEIRDGHLYLIGLSGTLKDGTQANLATVFPDFPERVFAHWYSGQLRVPQGKQLEYVHMGYASTYEEDLLIEIEKGVVVSTEIRRNGTSLEMDAPEGYGIGAMTVFPRKQGVDDV